MADIGDWIVWVATAIGINVASMAIWKKMNQPKVFNFIIYRNLKSQKNIKSITSKIHSKSTKMIKMIQR